MQVAGSLTTGSAPGVRSTLRAWRHVHTHAAVPRQADLVRRASLTTPESESVKIGPAGRIAAASTQPADTTTQWESFAQAASGEWDGVSITVDKDGEIQPLPEYYVPQASRTAARSAAAPRRPGRTQQPARRLRGPEVPPPRPTEPPNPAPRGLTPPLGVPRLGCRAPRLDNAVQRAGGRGWPAPPHAAHDAHGWL